MKVLEWFKTQLGKADQVVEEWHEGSSFYRKYANGFIIQGADVPITARQYVDVVYHQPFQNVTFPVINGPGEDLGGDSGPVTQRCFPFSATTSGFRFFCPSATTKVRYVACGY